MQKQEVIYSITCTANSKVYIGRTCSAQRRKREHFTLACKNNEISIQTFYKYKALS